MKTAYYNEIEPQAAQWLRELIKLGLIAPGDVDNRSIKEVQADDLKGYNQCHFFAGIGVWSRALRGAWWGDDRPVWTGSCPCQPFSSAGNGKGTADERHLWPEFFRLIKECRPSVVFGEQVAGKPGLTWLDAIQSDLEDSEYACGSVTFPACSIGAPHQRQRLYWVAELGDATGDRLRGEGPSGETQERKPRPGSQGVLPDGPEGRGPTVSMADTDGDCGCEGVRKVSTGQQQRDGCDCIANRVGDSDSEGLQEHGRSGDVHLREQDGQDSDGQHLDSGVDGGEPCGPGPTNGFWGSADWLWCRDEKWRPVGPGTFPLVDGAPSKLVPSCDLSLSDTESTGEARVMRLKGYGNAIVADQARLFIETYSEVRGL